LRLPDLFERLPQEGKAIRRGQVVRFLLDDEATTAVEYAVMLALILVAIIAGLTSAGGGVGTWWGNIRTKVTSY
jgi:pilus assembly protein Flp/PilA